MTEAMAAQILQAAIDEGRASELLDALFNGGSATIDARSHHLVIIDADMLAAFQGGSFAEEAES